MKTNFHKKFILILFLIFSAIRIFPADSTVVTQIIPGATLIEHYISGPIALKELILNLDSIKIGSALTHNYLGNGGEKTSSIFSRIASKNRNLIAAINADFFGGKPHRIVNSMVMNGVIIKGVNIGSSQFAVTKNGEPRIGIFGFRGKIFRRNFSLDVKSFNDNQNKPALFNFYYNRLLPKDSLTEGIIFKILKQITVADTIPIIVEKFISNVFTDTLKHNEIFLNLNGNLSKKYFTYFNTGDTLNFLGTFDSLSTHFNTLVGGRPLLIKNGKAIKNFFGVENLKSAWFIGKNPRTAIGFNKERRKIFVVTVDGRQKGYSKGMTLPELANFLEREGAYKAVNLDGGGSTTMVIKGQIINSPSDSTGERPVHNAILFFKK
jgi:hypothetical protein